MVFIEDEIGFPHSMLNFSYKVCIRKHVQYMVLHNTTYFNEPDLDVGEEVLEVAPVHGHVRRHLIKVLIREFEALHEIIATSITIKCVIQMLNPKAAGMFSSETIVQDVEKYVETLGVYEDLASSDKGIFLGCSINSRIAKVFNKHTKSSMASIKVLVNGV